MTVIALTAALLIGPPTLENLGALHRDQADAFHADQTVPPTWFLVDGWEALGAHRQAEEALRRAARTSGRTVAAPTPAGPVPGFSEVVAAVNAEAAVYGWHSGPEWDELSALINKESGWNPLAQNPTSTAYGLAQFLDGTWSCCGIAKTSDPALQARAMMLYILHRYGNPSAAMAHSRATGWY
jgi:hypothetical protein